MAIAVSDVRSSAERQIESAAKALGQSSQRRAVFREIHTGKKRVKTVEEIAQAISLPRKRVLEEAVKLAHTQIITKTKRNGDTAYERDNFYYAHRKEIFKRADAIGRGAKRRQESGKKAPPARGEQRPRAPRPRGKSSRRYDVFLSHASEDKGAIARPLYQALTKAGISVWFDEAELTLGDSLRRKIDGGLSRCRYGIVILSPRFFAKDWPQRELDGLMVRENSSGEKAILPIWHKVTKSQVAKFSPMLADRLSGNSREGVPALVRKIKKAMRRSPRG